MRRLVVVTLVVIASASCASAIRWEKPGVSAGEQQRDETDCTSLASRAGTIPTAQAVGTSPGTPNDPTRAQIQRYDVATFEDCMATRGYKRVPASPPA